MQAREQYADMNTVGAMLVPGFILLHPAANFCDRRMLLLSSLPVEFVEQNPCIVIANSEPSDLVQLALIFEQFMNQILSLIFVLVITAAIPARRFPVAFTVLLALALTFFFRCCGTGRRLRCWSWGGGGLVLRHRHFAVGFSSPAGS
jgi:hypothetical protein